MISSLVAYAFVAQSAFVLNVAVDGDGYLRFLRGGSVVYSRSCALTVIGGKLSGTDGSAVTPTIAIPPKTGQFRVDLEGNVFSGTERFGRLVIGLIPPSAKLKANGGYWSTTDKVTISNPGEGLAGIIRMVSTTTKPSTGPKATAQEISIRVQTETYTASDRIYLRDIATLTGSNALKASLGDVDLGQTPSIGGWRGITDLYILSKLRQAKFDVERIKIDVPPGARVARKAQAISRQELVDIALEAVAIDQPAVKSPKLEGEARELLIPEGEYRLEAVSTVASGNGVTVILVAKQGDKRVGSRTLWFKVTPEAKLEQNKSIPAGSSVKVRLQLSGAKVEVSGKISSAAKIGGRVNVETSTGSRHSGVLINATTVEVTL